jgi:hypothetical protein
MSGNRHLINILLTASLLVSPSAAVAKDAEQQPASQVGVDAKYDTTHVYVAPEDVDKFVASFLATFGGQSTKQVVATVTPTPSSTTSQLLQTPAGSSGNRAPLRGCMVARETGGGAPRPARSANPAHHASLLDLTARARPSIRNHSNPLSVRAQLYAEASFARNLL